MTTNVLGTLPHQPHVLVVDDEHGIRRALARILRQKGMVPVETWDVASALAALVALRACAANLVGIICDFDLPDGTGRDVYDHVGQPARFVLHTANHDAVAVLPDCAVVFKPDLPALLQHIDRWRL